MSVSCECCVLSGRGLCDGLVTPSQTILTSEMCLSMISKPEE
jgi:hypothetical protein